MELRTLRTLELINLDVDGRLDAAGRAELESLLAADPAARERHAQLTKLAQMLTAAPAPRLPPDFAETVISRVRWSKLRGSRAARRTRRVVLYALAASAALAAVGLQLLNVSPQGPPHHLTGTLAHPDDRAGARVTAESVAGGVLLTFELPPGPVADLVIDFPPSDGKSKLAASLAGADAAPPRVQGRRIVLPQVGGGTFELRVQGAEATGEFAAILVRDGVASPVARDAARSDEDR